MSIGRWVMGLILSVGVVLLVLSKPALALSQSPIMPEANIQTLPTSIVSKLQQANINPNDISVLVQPIGGKPIINHLSDTPRTPASTQKLIPTAVALMMLGADYHWQTRIYLDGVQIGKVFYGNVIIRGAGDPAMTHERLTAMLAELIKLDIWHIDGDIVIDDLAFEGVAFDVNAFDGQGLRAYNAQPNALLVNFGTLELRMIPSGVYQINGLMNTENQPSVQSIQFVPRVDDNTVALSVFPSLANFKAPNSIQGISGACNSEPKFGLQHDKLLVSGALPVSCGWKSQWLTFADSGILAQKAVLGVWQQLGATLTGQVRQARKQEFDTSHKLPIINFPSRPLSEQIKQINQYSNNVMTEQLALSLPLAMGEQVSTYPKTFALIQSWWQTNLKGTPPVMSRASGLCRDCQIQPRALAELLLFMRHQPEFAVFRASLPVVGQTGTMKDFSKRQPDSVANGKAHIKTGRLNDVASIAGYITGVSGQEYVVVAMINAKDAANQPNTQAVLDEVINWTAMQ